MVYGLAVRDTIFAYFRILGQMPLNDLREHSTSLTEIIEMLTSRVDTHDCKHWELSTTRESVGEDVTVAPDGSRWRSKVPGPHVTDTLTIVWHHRG